MKSISERISEGMLIRNMKQVDIIERTGINKGALSSYISGKYEPKQTNIFLIAKALNVSETWLMGYDVPMEKIATDKINYMPCNIGNVVIEQFTKNTNSNIPTEYWNKFNKLSSFNKEKVINYTDGLLKLQDQEEELNAAHAIPDATIEEIQHDEDIMNDDNF